MDGKVIRRQYFCICAGQQEEMYLQHLSRLLHTDMRRVTFTIKKGLPGYILKQRHIQYYKAVLFDHDGDAEEFHKALGICTKAKCAHAYSNRNFDLWLLLHKRNFSSCVSNNQAYVNEIRDAFGLSNEADIKNKKVLESIFEKITLDDVKDAIRRAQKILKQKLPGDAKQFGSITCYDNPDFSIHTFIKTVFSECKESYHI